MAAMTTSRKMPEPRDRPEKIRSPARVTVTRLVRRGGGWGCGGRHGEISGLGWGIGGPPAAVHRMHGGPRGCQSAAGPAASDQEREEMAERTWVAIAAGSGA